MQLGILAVLFAFCSIVYELLLGQMLSATLGDTFFRYVTTMAAYLAGLGLGAYFYEKKKLNDSEALSFLIRTEYALCSLGALSPVLVLSFFWLGSQGVPSVIVSILHYSLAMMIAILSGYELPALMQLSGKNARMLSLDYLGTFVGAVLFGVWFIPKIGVFSLSFLIAALNAVGILVLASSRAKPILNYILAGALVFVFGVGVIFESSYREFWVELLYMANLGGVK